jgi:maleylpyruvate isomerase
MLKLYNYYASSTSYRTRIVLNLKGLAYEYVTVRLDKAEHLGEVYGAVNPMQGVPTLETEDGARLFQSGAIVEYLEEAYPDPPLLPTDPVGRAYVRAIADIVGCDMHPLNNLRVRNYVRDVCRHDVDGWVQHWSAPGFAAIEAMLCADTKRKRGFAHGDGPTIADAYIVSQVFASVRFKVDMAPYPEINAVVETCTRLPAFSAAHPSKQPDAPR